MGVEASKIRNVWKNYFGGSMEVKVACVTGTSCVLKWTPVDDDEFPILRYIIEMQRGWRLNWENCGEAERTALSTTIEGIEYGTGYRFRIVAFNCIGNGRELARTKLIVPFVVRPPRLERDSSSKTIKLRWDMLDDDIDHRIEGYHVEKNRQDSTFGWLRVTDDLITRNFYKVSELEAGKWYRFRIVVVQNETEFIGEQSKSIDAVDLPGIPGQLDVFDITYQSCRLQWSPPDFNGGSNILRYTIESKENRRYWTKYCDVPGEQHIVKIDRLNKGDTYVFRIRAVNKLGAGETRQSNSVKAFGLDLGDQKSLAVMEISTLDLEGMSSIKDAFHLGLSTVVDMLDSLQPLMSSVTYGEVQVVAKNLQFYADRLFTHMKITSEKLETLNVEISKRMEAAVNEQGKTERIQRKNVVESEASLKHLTALQNELKELRKEHSTAVKEYERAMRALREAEKELDSKRDTRDTVAYIGKVGLFIPIFGWAVSAVTLPVAYTVLTDHVDAAKSIVDTQSKNRDHRRERVETKNDCVNKYEKNYSSQQEEIKKLQEEINDLKKVRHSLQLKMNQLIEVGINMKQCTTFVGGAADRAEVLQDQVKLLYDLSIVVDPLRELTTYFSLPEANKLGLLSDNLHMMTVTSKLQMFADSVEHLQALAIPDHQKDLRIVPRVSCSTDQSKAIKEIDRIASTISSNAAEDQKLILAQYSDCSEFLGSAPMTIALLGQLNIIALKQDFSLNDNPPKGGFKHIRWPESFRASMLQMTNAGWNAFAVAQRNMDKIRMLSMYIPQHLQSALRMLESANNEEIRKSLPKPLQLIKEASVKCLQASKISESEFVAAINLIGELQETCIAKRSKNEKQRRILEAELEENRHAEKQYEEERKRDEEEKDRNYESIRRAERRLKEAVDSAPSSGKVIALATADKVLSGVKGALDFVSSPFKTKETKQAEKEKKERNDESSRQSKRRLSEAVDSAQSMTTHNISREDAKRLFKAIEPLSDVSKLFKKYLNFESEITVIKIDDGGKRTNKIKAKFKRVLKGLENLATSDVLIKQAETLCNRGGQICKELEEAADDISGNSSDLPKLAGAIECLRQDIKNCIARADKLLEMAFKPGPVANQRLPKYGSDSSAVSYELEKVRLRVESSYQQLRRADEECDRLAEKARKTREELTELLRETAKVDMEKVDLETVGILLCKCLKQLGSLKEQWGRLVSFFQTINNVIEISLNDNLKNFLELSAASGSNETRQRELTALKRELLYQQVFKASEIANFVQHVTESYTEVSRRYFLPVVETLPRLINLSPDKNLSDMNVKLVELQRNCSVAQTQINKFLDQKQREYSNAVTDRISKLRSVVHKDIPKIEQTVEDLNVDDFS